MDPKNPTAYDARELIADGRLVVTGTSRKTGEHITLRLKCKNRDLHQRYITLADAKIVGVDAGRISRRSQVTRSGETHEYIGGDMVGWFFANDLRQALVNGRRVEVKKNEHADDARYWLAQEILDWIVSGKAHPQIELKLESFCSHCGRQCTDPVSIERGRGPVCYAKVTGSKHQTRSKREREIVAENEAEAASEAPSPVVPGIVDPTRTRQLYDTYVSNGLADTDGYFGPISFEAFSQMSPEDQEMFAR